MGFRQIRPDFTYLVSFVSTPLTISGFFSLLWSLDSGSFPFTTRPSTFVYIIFNMRLIPFQQSWLPWVVLPSGLICYLLFFTFWLYTLLLFSWFTITYEHSTEFFLFSKFLNLLKYLLATNLCIRCYPQWLSPYIVPIMYLPILLDLISRLAFGKSTASSNF